jgi:hypothetical protein
MNFHRSFRKCEEFKLCCAYGDKGVVYVEKHEDNKTLYSIQAKGSGRCSTIFNSDYIEGHEKNANFGCMKQFIGKHLIFESYEPFLQYGFSTLTYDQDWDGELVKKSFHGKVNSWLVCFKGNPVINGVTLKALDYAKLDDKDYDVQLNDSLVGVFTKIWPLR